MRWQHLSLPSSLTNPGKLLKVSCCVCIIVGLQTTANASMATTGESIATTGESQTTSLVSRIATEISEFEISVEQTEPNAVWCDSSLDSCTILFSDSWTFDTCLTWKKSLEVGSESGELITLFTDGLNSLFFSNGSVFAANAQPFLETNLFYESSSSTDGSAIIVCDSTTSVILPTTAIGKKFINILLKDSDIIRIGEDDLLWMLSDADVVTTYAKLSSSTQFTFAVQESTTTTTNATTTERADINNADLQSFQDNKIGDEGIISIVVVLFLVAIAALVIIAVLINKKIIRCGCAIMKKIRKKKNNKFPSSLVNTSDGHENLKKRGRFEVVPNNGRNNQTELVPLRQVKVEGSQEEDTDDEHDMICAPSARSISSELKRSLYFMKKNSALDTVKGQLLLQRVADQMYNGDLKKTRSFIKYKIQSEVKSRPVAPLSLAPLSLVKVEGSEEEDDDDEYDMICAPSARSISSRLKRSLRFMNSALDTTKGQLLLQRVADQMYNGDLKKTRSFIKYKIQSEVKSRHVDASILSDIKIGAYTTPHSEDEELLDQVIGAVDDTKYFKGAKTNGAGINSGPEYREGVYRLSTDDDSHHNLNDRSENNIPIKTQRSTATAIREVHEEFVAWSNTTTI